MEKERIETREQILKEGIELAAVHDRIMGSIHRSENEKQALKALIRFRACLEKFEKQNFYVGKQN